MKRYIRYFDEEKLDETCPEESKPKGGSCAKADNSGYLKGKCDKGFIWDDKKGKCIPHTD